MNDRNGIPLAVIVVTVAFALPIVFVGCYAGSMAEVSTGTQDVTVRKLSETGLIWKTWECEAATGEFVYVDGKGQPELRYYTVRHPEVVRRLQSVPIGNKVRIHYRKSLTVWLPKGESRYELTDIEILN